MVEGEFGHVRLRGEISGWKRAASGHAYLALKDADAVIDGVIWRGPAARSRSASGRHRSDRDRQAHHLSGALQIPDRDRADGAGGRRRADGAAREAQGQAGRAKGCSIARASRPLPYLPQVIGVVTSPTGAVIRDILHRLADRFPSRVLVWPVKVQGEGARRSRGGDPRIRRDRAGRPGAAPDL
jgi:exodeoxyribonuclease VII large subunit